ncbi:BT_3928 family protein [Bacteroidota bacterium]
MKIVDNVVRYFVGVLFIFSGLVKINDPTGTAIKLKEYFEVFANDFSPVFEILIPHSMLLSVLFSVMEVMLGIALLYYYRMKITSWLYLLLISFFTFLTFYSAYFNKVTDCGCFGDAIPLDPWESFMKDVLLIILVIYLFIRRKEYKSSRHTGKLDILMGVLTAFMIFVSIFSIRHLPYIDFRPYKVGNNIPEQMEPSDTYRYKYIVEKDGKEYVFEEYPADTTFQFKEMVLINPEAQPKITDYSIWDEEDDHTLETFEGKKLFIIIYDVNKASTKHISEINELISGIESDVDAWVLTSSNEEEFEIFRHENQLAVSIYYADMTVLEAIIRSNPGLWLLQDGVVKGKWHHNNIPSAEKLLGLLD